MTDQLQGFLAKATAKLTDDPAGHLALALRRRLWAHLGLPRKCGDRLSVGWRRRAELALLCVHAVAHLEAGPDPDFLGRVLDDADASLCGELAPSQGERRRGEYWTAMDDSEGELSVAAAFAGYTAVTAFAAVLHDEPFDPDRPDDGADDLDLDADQWDAAFFAAAARSQGLPGDPESSVRERREFWRWYLNEAVPAAWAAGAS